MRINNITPSPVGSTKSRKKSDATKSSFPNFSEEVSNEEGALEAVDALPNLNPFLALQEYTDPQQEEKDDLNKASKEILNSLSRIRIKLLSEDLTLDDLKQLKHIIDAQKMTFKTQEIQELYNQIRIKAEIELAKYGQQVDLVNS